MFKEVRTKIIIYVKCSKCCNEFVYNKQEKCPHCDISKDYIDISDIPF